MRFFVESWSTEYGAPVETPDEEEEWAKTDINVEVAAEEWQPITPASNAAQCIIFVDGCQQVDARLWTSDGAYSRMGVCVTIAAGRVRCDGAAKVEWAETRRVVFGPPSLGDIECHNGIRYEGVPLVDSTPKAIDTALRKQREDLEVLVAHSADGADLVVVDGHVRQRETIDGAVGYLKTHQARYLELPQAEVVSRLAPGQRSPVFLLETPWSRFSWYVRLPNGAGHPWAGVVRCEVSPSFKLPELFQFADFVTASLPRYASAPYKDPRAPQNLYPIAGLERDLRRRMGDQTLLLRALQRAARNS